MSKELVVSSNRHETRVALLEDDQLVEIYYQRQQEYSLAGSIHKGRVTRVLPGMQSAFVDIGLERDAFLYVSDFFEDNEEYDQIVTTVEEKVLRAEKSAFPAPILVTEEASQQPAEEAPAREAAVISPPGTAGFGAPSGDRIGPRDDRDRRGRRNRRRRGKPRGFPESKYAPPVSGESQPVEAPPADDDEESPLLLPGESLAKYSRGEDSPVHEPDAREARPEDAVEAAEPVPVEAPEAGDTAALSMSGIRWEPASEEEEHAALLVDRPVDLPVESPAMSAVSAVDRDPELASPDIEVLPAVEARVNVEDEEATAEVEGEETNGAEDGVVEAGSDESPEPARIPTSLTATLREQGPRYPHRVSRRMRRKMRGGQEEVRPDHRPEARHESRHEPRREDRPERTEARPPAPDQRTTPRPERDRPLQPSISDLLREGQEIIVQIAKEPLGQKGARITSYVALPGRFVVYMPTVDHVGVSRKIGSDEERLRLKRILQTHRQGIPGGFIMRTAGEGKTEEELGADMHFLYNLWLEIRQKAEKKKAPALVHHDLDVVQRILRDQLTSTFKTIWVDHEELYANVVGFVQRFQPALVNRVKLYTRPTPIFDAFNITAELEKALRPKVWLKSGGYIVINQTEALVAIDINTGKYVGKSNRLEDTIVKTNTDAIKEIVRQIRLRDLGGIIVVDFIDMDERKNRQKVMQALEEAMRADKAPNKILQFNDFGLVAITRKRVKQSLERTLCSPCPYCEGAGYVKSVATVIGEILQEAHKIAKAVEGADVMLRVNPDVAKVLKSHNNDYLNELEEILGRTVMVKSDPVLHQDKFDLA